MQILSVTRPQFLLKLSVFNLGGFWRLFPPTHVFILPFTISIASTVSYFAFDIFHLEELETAFYHFPGKPVNLKFLSTATLIFTFEIISQTAINLV